MKKLLILSLACLSLVACAANPTNQETKTSTFSTTATVKQTVTINVTEDGKAIENSPFTLSFKEGDTLLDTMKANMKIEEQDGLITSINGVKQDAAKQKYWLFDVNGKMSEVGASSVVLKAGDVIDWKLEAYQEK